MGDSRFDRLTIRTALVLGFGLTLGLWFFAGYQHLRDYDSQPGTDPQFPRAYEQDKVFAKVTWRLIPFLLLLYIVAWLDRVNVGFAALQMNEDLGFSAEPIRLVVSVFTATSLEKLIGPAGNCFL